MAIKINEEVSEYFKLFLNEKFSNFDKTVEDLHGIIGEVKDHQKSIDKTIFDLQLTVNQLVNKNHSKDDCPHKEIIAKIEKKNTIVEFLVTYWWACAIVLIYFVIVGLKQYEIMAEDTVKQHQIQTSK